jgi:hypothetical protein
VKTITMPVRKVRRGPNWPAILPRAGWAVALATYRAATRTAVRPAGTRKCVAMGTSAVAMIELFTGLSADPTTSGVMNRRPNATRVADAAAGPVTGCQPACAEP